MFIQISNPSFITPDAPYEDISDVLESAVKINTERLIIFIGRDSYAADYRYDVSKIITDIVYICSQVSTFKEGDSKILFSSNTFFGIWHIRWLNGELSLEIIDSGYDLDSFSTSHGKKYVMRVSEFLSEWCELFRLVIKIINETKVTIFDDDELQQILAILSLKLPRGKLYCSD